MTPLDRIRRALSAMSPDQRAALRRKVGLGSPSKPAPSAGRPGRRVEDRADDPSRQHVNDAALRAARAMQAHFNYLNTPAGEDWFLNDCAERARRGEPPLFTPPHLRSRAEAIRRRGGQFVAGLV